MARRQRLDGLGLGGGLGIGHDPEPTASLTG